MEKRTERNKELYKEINRKIAALAKKSSNEPLECNTCFFVTIKII